MENNSLLYRFSSRIEDRKSRLSQFFYTICKRMGIFHEISAITSEFDETMKKTFEKLIENIDCENYLIYSEGRPVGTGILFPNGKIGGIFNISTLPTDQRKGYGKAMMLFLMNRASELGLEHLLLLSSPAAVKLYTDLGFKKAFNMEIFFKKT